MENEIPCDEARLTELVDYAQAGSEHDFNPAIAPGELLWLANQARKQARGEAAIKYLFRLLDDIDTADDMAKSNDVAYRTMVRKIQDLRWETGITTDGYTLDLSKVFT